MIYIRDVLSWAKKRLLMTPKRDNRISYGLIFLFWIVSSVTAGIYAVGNPTGATFLSHIGNMVKIVGLNSLLFLVATILLGIIFSLLYIPSPRLFLGSFIYAMFINVAILLGDSSGTLFSYVVGIGYSVAVLLIGLLIIIMLMYRKAFRITLLVVFGAAAIAISASMLVNAFSSHESAVQVVNENTDKEENPAVNGSYDYSFFTYGSGEDIQREEFGETVNELTPSVDASDLITNWKDDRSDFWGYDETNLPINGRTWMPEGHGPFPVVLMVHGNHVMEEFSTDGYDYLGEMLASRGFIAISVDEDFLNYSNVTGSPSNNYKVRAWMLIKHMEELQQMNQSPESKLYEEIDFDQVALMGHSRGGQAVLMAADYETFFDDEHLLSSMDNINIKGVVSVAPTDKKIDDSKPHLHNISYLFLGGGMDADVSDFRGDRQYYRSTFDADDDGFKSTLYIANGNHTQFNTSWGRSDLSLPRGLFLNYRDLMDPEAQQQIAKVYMSAFMESIFHGQHTYRELFKDYHYGSEWLPDTPLVNKYQDASYTPIVQYKANKESSIDAYGFKQWEIITPEDRAGTNRLSDALELEWDSDATYSINLSKDDFETGNKQPPQQLVLTLANAYEEDSQSPDIDIEMEMTDRASVQHPLDDFHPFPPVISTEYTSFGLFEGMFREGKYEPSWAPTFQTFSIPLDVFQQDDELVTYKDFDTLKLHFKDHSGKILVEEIGVQ